MIYKPFGEYNLSALGLGCLRFPTAEGDKNRIDRVETQKIIDAAFESGINYFDTAYTYQKGDSERFLGEALAKYPRESYCLATKYYSTCGKDIREVFDEQLKRCKTDYFDVYMLHCLDENTIGDYMDSEMDCLGFMLEQKRLGKIRKIGFSTHAAPDVLERFLNWYDGFDMAIMQLNYLDWTLLDAKRQYEILTEHGIPVWVMEPLKGGRLAALNDSASALLKECAPERSVPSWGFRFLMGLPNVQMVLSGMSTVEQIRENANLFSTHQPLSDQEKETLDRAAKLFMEEMGVPCSACRYCCPTCPKGLNIPLLLQGYNEMRVSRATWKIPELDRVAGPEECIGCGSCLEHCPQKIDIPAAMAHFAELRKR